MAEKKLTVTLFVGDREVKTLSPEQREALASRLSKTMSTFYTAHSAEYEKVQRGKKK